MDQGLFFFLIVGLPVLAAGLCLAGIIYWVAKRQMLQVNKMRSDIEVYKKTYAEANEGIDIGAMEINADLCMPVFTDGKLKGLRAAAAVDEGSSSSSSDPTGPPVLEGVDPLPVRGLDQFLDGAELLEVQDLEAKEREKIRLAEGRARRSSAVSAPGDIHFLGVGPKDVRDAAHAMHVLARMNEAVPKGQGDEAPAALDTSYSMIQAGAATLYTQRGEGNEEAEGGPEPGGNREPPAVPERRALSQFTRTSSFTHESKRKHAVADAAAKLGVSSTNAAIGPRMPQFAPEAGPHVPSHAGSVRSLDSEAQAEDGVEDWRRERLHARMSSKMTAVIGSAQGPKGKQ